MSYRQASGAAALLQRRSEWVASLRESLPNFTEATASPLQRGSRAAVFNHNERHVLDDAVKSSLLLLPTDWREEATQRLAHTLHGVVEPQTLRQCDYFLCSLIHPTYVQASTMPSKKKEESQQRRIQQQLRRTVCMPLELTMTGSKSLRLMREVGGVVGAGQSSSLSRRAAAGEQNSASGPRGGGGSSSSSSSGRVSGAIQYELEATWPELKTANTRACLHAFRDAALDSLVLYDRQAFPAAHLSASTAAEAGQSVVVPAEVSLSAFTALCGSIELVAGWASLVHYLDRVARQHGS